VVRLTQGGGKINTGGGKINTGVEILKNSSTNRINSQNYTENSLIQFFLRIVKINSVKQRTKTSVFSSTMISA
jgi:hypothetical protein